MTQKEGSGIYKKEKKERKRERKMGGKEVRARLHCRAAWGDSSGLAPGTFFYTDIRNLYRDKALILSEVAQRPSLKPASIDHNVSNGPDKKNSTEKSSGFLWSSSKAGPSHQYQG